eukprot:5601996-Amphidinium_carterae.1
MQPVLQICQKTLTRAAETRSNPRAGQMWPRNFDTCNASISSSGCCICFLHTPSDHQTPPSSKKIPNDSNHNANGMVMSAVVAQKVYMC